MKKKFLLTLFFFIALLFIINGKCNANSISSIEMDVNIDKNGNAHVTEVWKASLYQGTEGYRAFKNTAYSNFSISNFSVEMDDNSYRTNLSFLQNMESYEQTQYQNSDILETTKFSYVDKWNTEASFSDKKYKCGIHKISKGVELCWGISQYGSNKYILKYTINNFVSQYTDTQGIYFNLLNLDQWVGSAKILIHSDVMPLSLENARIWGFGYNGSIVFSDGAIVMDSQGMLNTSDYMVALVRLQENAFNTSNRSKYSFDKIYESATEGFIETTKEAYYIERALITILWVATLMLPFAVTIAIMIKSAINLKTMDKTIEEYEHGTAISRNEEPPFWREIPCDKNLDFAYWVANTYHIESSDTFKKGIIGAILLKWVYENRITVTKTKKGLFDISNNNYAVDLSNIGVLDNETEDALYRLLKRAAGSNRILEPNELKKWCKENYTSLGYFFDDTLRRGKKYVKDHGYVSTRIEEIPHKKRMQKITHIIYSDALRQEAIKLKGLKKFLLDYSLIQEKETIEVHLWKEYLMFANLLGIADKVGKQFKKLYPDFNPAPEMDVEITHVMINGMVREAFKGTASGRNAAYSGSSSYSGGGGSSFSSGGSSSGGSSGGGFR